MNLDILLTESLAASFRLSEDRAQDLKNRILIAILRHRYAAEVIQKISALCTTLEEIAYCSFMIGRYIDPVDAIKEPMRGQLHTHLSNGENADLAIMRSSRPDLKERRTNNNGVDIELAHRMKCPCPVCTAERNQSAN